MTVSGGDSDDKPVDAKTPALVELHIFLALTHRYHVVHIGNVSLVIHVLAYFPC